MTSDGIDDMLERLRETCLAPAFSRNAMKHAMENVLVWLTEHDTDQNCRMIDVFVSTRIDAAIRTQLPPDIAEILFDMGGALHDTHTAREIAENFWSTPGQLLARTRELPY